VNNEYLCRDCVVDVDIRQYILLYGENKKCTICGKYNECVIVNDKNLIRMVRALIRYHYPEYMYNTHWGADDRPEGLLLNYNPIIRRFDKNFMVTREEYKFILSDIIGGIDSNHEISLYKRSIYGERDLFGLSLKQEGTYLWKSIISEITNTNYSDLIDKYKMEIANLLKKNKEFLIESTIWYRSRIGYERVSEKHDVFEYETVRNEPYKDEEIMAPPSSIATGGRANREGISYYYLSNTEETAIAEVRPHPGHYVSVAKFYIENQLNILNLYETNLLDFSKSEKELLSYVAFREFANEFEVPLIPELRNRYLKSQLISDIAKILGYDGILYNSSVAEGINIVIFDRNKVKYEKNSSVLYKIIKHCFKVGKIKNEINFLEQYEEKIIE